MLTDVASLVIALVAIKVVAKAPSDSHTRFTYGWYRAEILAAMVNGVFLLALCLSIVLQAIERYLDPNQISNPKLVVIVGCLGLLSNVVGFFILGGHGHSHGHSHGHGHSHAKPAEAQHPIAQDAQTANETTVTDESGMMNIRALLLHIIGDALGNLSVIASGLIVWLTKVHWKQYIDPTASIVIAFIMFFTTVSLVKTTSSVLLQAAPSKISVKDVSEQIRAIDNVLGIHELHIWQLSETQIIATVHILVHRSSDFAAITSAVRNVFHDCGIHSASVQPEYPYEDSINDTADVCLVACTSRDNDLVLNVCCPPKKSTV